MELVEIKDIRIGQVWKNKTGIFVIINNVNKRQVEFCYLLSDGTFNHQQCSDSYFAGDDFEFKGFLNITHKLENNKLIEIKREEIEMGDILFNKKYNSYHVIWEIANSGEFLLINGDNTGDSILIANLDNSWEEEGYHKCGIYGVNFEFINKKLINKE